MSGPWEEKGTYGRLDSWLEELAEYGDPDTLKEIKVLVDQLISNRIAQAFAIRNGDGKAVDLHQAEAKKAISKLNEQY